MATIPDGHHGRLTIKQIAEMAQVSRSTVSRVINGHVSVHPKVRNRVQRIITEHHYIPQSAARGLVRQRSDLVGLVFPWNIPTDPFFATIVNGLSEAFSDAGYFLMVSLVPSHMRQSFVDRIVRSSHFDGLVMALGDVNDPTLPLFRDYRTPLVLIDHHPLYENFSCVYAANREGAQAAVGHLIALGHRRIATITGPLRMVSALDRRDGYEQALADAGIELDPDLIREASFTSTDTAYRVMSDLLDRSPHPTAVFAGNDVIAIGALRAIREAGLSTPDDIAVVGFDDSPVAISAEPPLTTVHQPGHDLGTTAANLLIQQLRNPDNQPQHIKLPTSLVIRQSCGARRGA